MSRRSVEAVLQAGDSETLYRRAGDGPPVLILCTGVLADPLGGCLFERLATCFRVVATAPPGGEPPADGLVTWLGDVIEGLGLVRPSVVLDHALAGMLPGETCTLAGVVAVIAAEAGGADVARGALEGALVVAVETGDAAAVADTAASAMTPFLAGRGC